MLTKLGPHITHSTSNGIAWAQVADIMKCIDDPGPLWATGAKIRIFRRNYKVAGVDYLELNIKSCSTDAELKAIAIWYVDGILYMLGNAPATHVQISCELMQRLGEGLEKHAKFTGYCVEYLGQVRPDLTDVCYGFSTGSPEEKDWEWLQANNYGYAKCIGLNEYWGSWSDGSAKFDPWNPLRHELIHEWTRANHPPFIITECFRDIINTQPSGSWQQLKISAEQGARELAKYEWLLHAAPYVLGAVAFTTGAMGIMELYDLDNLVPMLLPYYQNNKKEEETMSQLFRERWPAWYEEWMRAGGIPDVDFFGWVCAVKGCQPTAPELQMIAEAAKGNVQALANLAKR